MILPALYSDVLVLFQNLECDICYLVDAGIVRGGFADGATTCECIEYCICALLP